MVWGYALAWFLVTDPVKLLAYRVLDATKAAPALQSKVQPRSDAKAAPMPPSLKLKIWRDKLLPNPMPVSKLPVKVEPQSAVKARSAI